MAQAYFLVHQVTASTDQHVLQLQLIANDDAVSVCIANDINDKVRSKSSKTQHSM